MTLGVLKWDKFNEVNDLQLENIPLIIIAWEVSKLEISNDSKEIHPSNKQSIFWTDEVLKFDKSNDFNDRQLVKVLRIEINDEVSKLLGNIIFFKLVQL